MVHINNFTIMTTRLTMIIRNNEKERNIPPAESAMMTGVEDHTFSLFSSPIFFQINYLLRFYAISPVTQFEKMY